MVSSEINFVKLRVEGTWNQLLPADAHGHDAQVVHGRGPGSMIRDRNTNVVLLSTQVAYTISCCSRDKQNTLNAIQDETALNEKVIFSGKGF